MEIKYVRCDCSVPFPTPEKEKCKAGGDPTAAQGFCTDKSESRLHPTQAAHPAKPAWERMPRSFKGDAKFQPNTAVFYCLQ